VTARNPQVKNVVSVDIRFVVTSLRSIIVHDTRCSIMFYGILSFVFISIRDLRHRSRIWFCAVDQTHVSNTVTTRQMACKRRNSRPTETNERHFSNIVAPPFRSRQYRNHNINNNNTRHWRGHWQRFSIANLRTSCV